MVTYIIMYWIHGIRNRYGLSSRSMFALKGVSKMPHVIAQPCIGVKDAACVAVCPVDCIHPRTDEQDFAQHEQLFINPEECIDCGWCVDACPVAAIFTETDLPAEWARFAEINAAHFRKK